MSEDLKQPTNKSSLEDIKLFIVDRDAKIRKANAEIQRWFNQARAADKLFDKKKKRGG